MRNIGGVLVVACASLFFACGEGEEKPPTQPTGPAAPTAREPTVKANWEMGQGGSQGGGETSGSGDSAPVCEGNDDCEPPLVCSAAGRCRTPEEAANDVPQGGGGLGGGGLGGGLGGGCLDDSDCADGEVCDVLFGFCYDPGAGGGLGGGGGGGTGSGTLCVDDFDCPIDEECGPDNTCVPYGSATGGPCLDDFDCSITEICVEGTCEPY